MQNLLAVGTSRCDVFNMIIGALSLRKNCFLPVYSSLRFEVGTIPFLDYTMWKSMALLFYYLVGNFRPYDFSVPSNPIYFPQL